MRRSFLVLCIAAAFAVGACVTDPGATGAPGAESPGATAGQSGSRQSGSRQSRRERQRGGRVRPGVRVRNGRLLGLAGVAGGGRGPRDGARRVRGGVPQHHRRLPAGRRRLSGGDGREVQRRRTARPVLRRLERRARVDRRGRPRRLEPLAAERGFDTSAFFPGYLDAFKGPDGKIYGFPKDGNTLAMAYNAAMLEAAGIEPPTNWEELQAAAEALTTGDQKAFCLNHCARPGARLHLPERRLAAERGQDPEHVRFAGDARRAPDVPRLVRQRPGAPARPTSATTGAASPSARARSRSSSRAAGSTRT